MSNETFICSNCHEVLDTGSRYWTKMESNSTWHHNCPDKGGPWMFFKAILYVDALKAEREKSTGLRLVVDAIATGLWEMGDNHTLNKLDHSTLLTVARYKLDKDSPGLLTDEARTALQDTASWGCAPEGGERCSCERTEGLEARVEELEGNMQELIDEVGSTSETSDIDLSEFVFTLKKTEDDNA